MENLGVQKAVVKTVFAYKVNVAISAILLFFNMQAFALVLSTADNVMSIIVGFLLFVACLAYALLSLNGYLTKIIVYEGGFVIKNLFRKAVICENKIKKAAFHRMNLKKIMINVAMYDGRDIKINGVKYDDIKPLIEYLKKFK